MNSETQYLEDFLHWPELHEEEQEIMDHFIISDAVDVIERDGLESFLSQCLRVTGSPVLEIQIAETIARIKEAPLGKGEQV